MFGKKPKSKPKPIFGMVKLFTIARLTPDGKLSHMLGGEKPAIVVFTKKEVADCYLHQINIKSAGNETWDRLNLPPLSHTDFLHHVFAFAEFMAIDPVFTKDNSEKIYGLESAYEIEV